MKKFLLLSLMLLTTVFSYNVFAQSGTSDASASLSRQEVKLRKIKNSDRDRSLSADVSAWYDTGTQTVIIEGAELKDTDVYIVGYDGMVMTQTSYYFGMFSETYILDAPGLSGRYWLIIDSPSLYADGSFYVK